MNNIDNMIELFYNTLVPGETCNTRILFRDMDLGLVRQSPFFKPPDVQYHQGKGPIDCIDHSAQILLFGFKEFEIKQKHHAFIPGTRLYIRTIFFKDGRKMVRLYNQDAEWSGDRQKIDLKEFLVRLNELDGNFTMERFEAFLFGVV